MSASAAVALLGATLAFGCGGAYDDGAAAPGAVVGEDIGGAPLEAIRDDRARYPIRVSWPAKKGARGHYHIESEDVRKKRRVRTSGPDEVEVTEERVIGDGVYEIVDADPAGRSVTIVIQLEALEADLGDGEPPIALKQSVIRVHRDLDPNRGHVTIDGRPATPRELRAIESLITTELADGPSDDQVFGTDEPQPVGGRWPVRGEIARQAMSEHLDIPHRGLRGEMRLQSVTERDGVAALEILGSVSATEFGLPGLPAGSVIARSDMRVKLLNVVPLKPMPRLEDAIWIEIEILARLPDGSDLYVTSEKRTRSRFKPLR